MNKENTASLQNSIPATVVDGVHYTAVATAVAELADLSKPAFRSVDPEFPLPADLARRLHWQDDFFDDDDDVVAVFDFDYEMMKSFYTNVGWAFYGASILYTPLFTIATLGLVPCFLRRNVHWSVHAQHVAVTRDGIRFVRDRRSCCWGMACTDMGKSSKTVPFDKITDCDIEEPAGNTCCCIQNVLCTVNVDTASSGNGGKKELQISGLKDPHSFKKLVWAMKRMRDVGISSGRAVSTLEMVGRDTSQGDGDVSLLLREIRDELRQNNALLQTIQPAAVQPVASEVAATSSAPSDKELV